MSIANQMNSNKSNAGRGGSRKGAGRKKGSVTQRTREIAERAVEEGITPLEVMLQAMRENHAYALEQPVGNTATRERRLALLAEAAELAMRAAPYMHPRLAAVEHMGAGGGPIQTETRTGTLEPDQAYRDLLQAGEQSKPLH